MRGKKRKTARKNSAATATSNLLQETTLVSLPNELLLWIFESLDDRTLYHLGILCRRINSLALPIIIQRHCPELQEGNLDLMDYDPTLYAAICASITITELDWLSITLLPTSQALVQLKALSGVVESKGSLQSLYIILEDLEFASSVSKKERERICEALTLELKRFLNVSIEKGCTDMHITGTWGPLYAVGKKWELKSNLGTPSTGPLRRSSRMRIPSAKLLASGTLQCEVIENLNSADKVTDDYPSPANLTSLDLESPLLLGTFWRNWTLHLCNTAPLTTLEIDLRTSPWDDLLLQVHLTSLTSFKLTGSTANRHNLALFLQRHSDTLEELSISLPGLSSSSMIQSIDRDTESSDICHLPVLNFPQLFNLTVEDTDAPWFIKSVLDAEPYGGSRPYLPSLRCLALTTSSNHDLDMAFDALGELVTRVVEAGGNAIEDVTADDLPWDQERTWDSEPYWFDELDISFTQTRSELLTWLEAHTATARSRPSPISTLVCIRTLSVDGYVSDDKLFIPGPSSALDVLPPFFALFSGLRTLWIDELALGQVKTLCEEGYWKRVKDVCLVLEKCAFESGLKLGVEELVDLDEEGKCLWTEDEVITRQEITSDSESELSDQMGIEELIEGKWTVDEVLKRNSP